MEQGELAAPPAEYREKTMGGRDPYPLNGNSPAATNIYLQHCKIRALI